MTDDIKNDAYFIYLLVEIRETSDAVFICDLGKSQLWKLAAFSSIYYPVDCVDCDF